MLDTKWVYVCQCEFVKVFTFLFRNSFRKNITSFRYRYAREFWHSLKVEIKYLYKTVQISILFCSIYTRVNYWLKVHVNVRRSEWFSVGAIGKHLLIPGCTNNWTRKSVQSISINYEMFKNYFIHEIVLYTARPGFTF